MRDEGGVRFFCGVSSFMWPIAINKQYSCNRAHGWGSASVQPLADRNGDIIPLSMDVT